MCGCSWQQTENALENRHSTASETTHPRTNGDRFRHDDTFERALCRRPLLAHCVNGWHRQITKLFNVARPTVQILVENLLGTPFTAIAALSATVLPDGLPHRPIDHRIRPLLQDRTSTVIAVTPRRPTGWRAARPPAGQIPCQAGWRLGVSLSGSQ